MLQVLIINHDSHTSNFESNEAEGFRSTGLQSVPRGFPTPAVLGAVIRSTQELLTQQAGASLDVSLGCLVVQIRSVDFSMIK